MKILFLTNNKITWPLYEWLVEQGEEVTYCEKKVLPGDDIIQESEFVISYNYLYIIQPEIINQFPHRIINLHTSLLPWNRGISPNIFSFLEGTPLGVTIHEISAELDKGDILVQKPLSVCFARETLATAYKKSHDEITMLFIENWNDIKKGRICPRKQEGNGSYHRYSDLEPYKSIIDYEDTIDTFLNKAMPIYLNNLPKTEKAEQERHE